MSPSFTCRPGPLFNLGRQIGVQNPWPEHPEAQGLTGISEGLSCCASAVRSFSVAIKIRAVRACRRGVNPPRCPLLMPGKSLDVERLGGIAAAVERSASASGAVSVHDGIGVVPRWAVPLASAAPAAVPILVFGVCAAEVGAGGAWGEVRVAPEQETARRRRVWQPDAVNYSYTKAPPAAARAADFSTPAGATSSALSHWHPNAGMRRTARKAAVVPPRPGLEHCPVSCCCRDCPGR
jgi:hypothetical protein